MSVSTQMDRAKRTLVEAGPNVSAAGPVAKKASMETAASSEGRPFNSKTVAELASMPRARPAPYKFPEEGRARAAPRGKQQYDLQCGKERLWELRSTAAAKAIVL